MLRWITETATTHSLTKQPPAQTPNYWHCPTQNKAAKPSNAVNTQPLRHRDWYITVCIMQERILKQQDQTVGYENAGNYQFYRKSMRFVRYFERALASWQCPVAPNNQHQQPQHSVACASAGNLTNWHNHSDKLSMNALKICTHPTTNFLTWVPKVLQLLTNSNEFDCQAAVTGSCNAYHCAGIAPVNSFTPVIGCAAACWWCCCASLKDALRMCILASVAGLPIRAGALSTPPVATSPKFA